MNVKNTFILSGKVTGAPQVEDHPDNSQTIRFNISAKNNYLKRDGSESFETLPVTFSRTAAMTADSKRGNGLADTLKDGDSVVVKGSVRNDDWTDSLGQAHYGLVLQVEDLDILRPEAATPSYEA